MNHKEYVPDQRCCRLAARLWRRHMDNGPEFNQLGKPQVRGYSGQELVNEVLAQSLVSSICRDTSPEKLDAFEAELFRILMAEFPFKDVEDGERTVAEVGKPARKEKVDESWLRRQKHEYRMSVDYHANGAIHLALKKAGLKDELAPIKSSVDLGWEFPHVHASFGYGSPRVYYYPLDDAGNLWLVTSLYGDQVDIETLKRLALENYGHDDEPFVVLGLDEVRG